MARVSSLMISSFRPIGRLGAYLALLTGKPKSFPILSLLPPPRPVVRLTMTFFKTSPGSVACRAFLGRQTSGG